jgi:DNA repair and recombination protein RAD52
MFSDDIKNKLLEPLEKSHISYRQQGENTLSYIQTWFAIQTANEVFGYGGWSREIKEVKVVWSGIVETSHKRKRYDVSCICTGIVKVGKNVHEDVGYGSGMSYYNEGESYELAYKEAVSDCLKRCLRSYGDRFGNCLYDKTYEPQDSPTQKAKFFSYVTERAKKESYDLKYISEHKGKWDILIGKIAEAICKTSKGMNPENINLRMEENCSYWGEMVNCLQSSTSSIKEILDG